MIITISLLIFGLAILLFGAEALVRGAGSLARKFGIPPLVIGLTIVAFGTSAPEFLVNMYSAFEGSADIAIGNVIGSNIVNILLILGISAIILPLKVKLSTTWKEIPFALLGVVLVLIMGNDSFFDASPVNGLTRTDGFAFLAFFIVFLYYIVGLAMKEEKADENGAVLYSKTRSIVYVILGLVGLFFGGKFFVDNAVILARLFGISEAFIGLTIVAVGTSLPELATSIVASLKGDNDIAIGNIVGSNIFNVFWILGITSAILPLEFNVKANIDVGLAILATLLLFLALFIGKRHQVERWQGVIFVLLYVVYITYLIVRG